MKLFIYKKVSVFFIYMLVVVAIISCSDSMGNEDHQSLVDRSYVVTLSSRSLDSENPSVALSTDMDLKSLRVLAFYIENGEEVFSDIAKIINQKYNSLSNEYEVELNFKVPSYAKSASLVFIANAAILNKGEMFGKTKSQVLESTVFSTLNDAGSMLWNTSNSVLLHGIPMWGEQRNIDVLSPQNKNNTFNVSLKRALARVDFGFHYRLDDEGVVHDKTGENKTKGYKIASVHVYNYLDKGLIAPLNDGLSIPETASTVKSPYIYILENPSDKLVENKVFLAENKGGLYSVPQIKENATSFVLGIYNDVEFKNTPGYIRYFRCDLLNGDYTQEGVIKDIIRNKRYAISIDEIKGDGYDTPDEAHKRIPLIYATLTVKDWESDWVIGTEGNGGVEGVNRFKISTRNIELAAEKESNSIESIEFLSNVNEPLVITGADGLDVKVVTLNDSDDFGLGDFDGDKSPLYRYRLEVTPQESNQTKEIKELGFNVKLANFDIPVAVEQMVHRFEVLNISAEQHGRYIQDLKIDRDVTSVTGGKNEFIRVIIDYKNNIKETDAPYEYTLSVKPALASEHVNINFEPTKFIVPAGYREGQIELFIQARGLPEKIGDFKYEIHVDDISSYLDTNLSTLKDYITITSSYRAIRVLSAGDNTYAFAENKSAYNMLKQVGSFGNRAESLFKVQNIYLESTQNDRIFKDADAVNSFDVIYISYPIDIREGSVEFDNLVNFVNAGGYLIETNQSRPYIDHKNQLVDVLCNRGVHIDSPYTGITGNGGYLMKFELADVTDKLILGTHYNLLNKFLLLDYFNTTWISEVPVDAVPLAYIVNQATADLSTYRLPSEQRIVMIKHKTKNYIWSGDSGITSSDYGGGPTGGVLVTENNRPSYKYYHKTSYTVPQAHKIPYSPSIVENDSFYKKEDLVKTENASFLYNLFEYIIPQVHPKLVGDIVYTYGEDVVGKKK